MSFNYKAVVGGWVFFVWLVVFVLVFVSFMAVLLSMGDPSSSTRA